MKKSIVLVGIMLSGCSSPNIENQCLNDRVKACSAGFSQETQAALHASLEKAKLQGELSGDVKQETRSMIFSQMAEKDKLKAYEDYIKCIEKHWNHDD